MHPAVGGGSTPDAIAWLGAGVGFGFLSGWAVGYVLKKAALLLALALGTAFIVIQILVFNRMMSVDWAAVASVFGSTMHSIDGRESPMWKILLTNFPYASSFGVGFLMGFRRG